MGCIPRHEPSDVIVGFDGEFDAEGRFAEVRFSRSASLVDQRHFPAVCLGRSQAA
jgi:hypothetical protein